MSLVLTNSYLVRPSTGTTTLDALTYRLGSGWCSDDSKIRVTGKISVSRDFGATFTSYPVTSDNPRDYTCSSNGQYMYVAAYGGVSNAGIWRSADYGNTWNLIYPGNPSSSYGGGFYRVSTDSTGQYVVAGGFNPGASFKSNDFGATWTNAGWDGNSGRIRMSSSGQVVVVWAPAAGYITSSSVFVSSNYGTNFSTIANGDFEVGIDGTGDVILLASVTGDFLKLSTNRGATFTNLTSLGSQAWSRVAIGDNANLMVAQTTGGQKYVSYNSGSTWAAY